MSFFKRVADIFGGKSNTDGRFTELYVMSGRCREPIAGRVDLFNELSRDEDGKGYYARKVLHASSGVNRCFDQVEVQLWFDSNKRLNNHEVTGGHWLSAEEYAEELAIFNAPPEEPDEDLDEETDVQEMADE